MRLILARHGNTFAPRQAVVWAGSRNDLPLVQRGREQAAGVAAALTTRKPAAVYCGPLLRTRVYAEIITEQLALPAPIVDERLAEIDYGDWTGLTNDEVVARFGVASVTAWDERAEWPRLGRWGGSAAEMQARVRAFAQDMVACHRADTRVLVVSSNGTLRYFAALEPGGFAARQHDGQLKVKTGHVCELAHDGSAKGFTILRWDVTPSALQPG